MGLPKRVKFQGGILSRPLASCSGVKFSLQGKNFSGREYFAPKHKGRGPKCFPPAIFTNFGRPLDENFGWSFCEGEIKCIKFPISSTGDRISFRNLKAKVQNVSLQWFLRICAAHWPKIRCGLFDQGEIKWVKFPKSSTGQSSFLRNLKAEVQNVFLHWYLRILAVHWPKISVWSFWPACDCNLGLVIWRCNQIQNFFSGREYFAPKREGRGRKCFPAGLFTNFGGPLARNFGSVFLTRVRPELANFHNIPLERVFSSRTWRERSQMFPSRDIYKFWPPIGRNFCSVFLTRVRPEVSNFQNLPLERVFSSGTWR